jgi:hypothetical protein
MSIFGKCTEEIKTKVPFDTKNMFAALAHEAGMTESEYLRTLITLHVHGKEEIERLQKEQLNKIALRGLNGG